MWLPYFGHLFFPETESVKASEADKSERKFTVVLFLEELHSRKVQWSTLKIPQHYQTTIKLAMGTEAEKELEVTFLKNENSSVAESNTVSPDKEGRVGAIATDLLARDMLGAVREAYDVHSRLLSFICLMNGSNLPIFGVKVTDDKHKAMWYAKPTPSAPDEFGLPKLIGFGEAFRILLSLYREGKNNPSPPYRFFCFYKILEAFYMHKKNFSEIDDIIRTNNLPFKRPKRKITNDMLLQALSTHTEFKDLTFGTFFEQLRSNQRLQIAHVFPEKGNWANLDNFDLFREFVAIGNLTDLVARQILLDELGLWEKLNAFDVASGESKKSE